jgi:hypothetical protein
MPISTGSTRQVKKQNEKLKPSIVALYKTVDKLDCLDKRLFTIHLETRVKLPSEQKPKQKPPIVFAILLSAVDFSSDPFQPKLWSISPTSNPQTL